MSLLEGSIIHVNLFCGCEERDVTLIRGKQVIKCPKCGTKTAIEISANDKGEVSYVNIY